MPTRLLVLYVRVSSAEQAADGVSLDAQEAELRRWAATQEGQITSLREEGKSAYSGKRRPKYDELLALITSGQVAVVVAAHPDRLNRNVKEAIELRQLCQQHGTRIYTLSAGWVDTSAFGNFNANMLAAVAELESGIKSERVTNAFSYLRSEGVFVGRRPPWGYIRTPTSRRIVPSADARLVRRAFAMADKGATHSQIRDWLLQQPREEKTTGIKIQFVSKMLRNPVYAGYVVTDTKTAEPTRLPGNHEPLCPLEMFERIQARLDQNKKVGYTGSKYLPFGKLARCGLCDGPLRWKRTNDGRYFYAACNRFCGLLAMPAQYFEVTVCTLIDTTIQWIDEALLDGSWRVLLSNHAALEAADVELEKATHARESVRRALRDGLLTDDEARDDLAETKARYQTAKARHARAARSATELRADLEWLRDTLRNRDSHFSAWWIRADHPARIETLNAALQNVWLSDDRITFKFRKGLDLPFAVPITRSRFSRQVSDELTKIGFPPRVPEPDAGLRLPPQVRSVGRNRIPPCGAQLGRDSP